MTKIKNLNMGFFLNRISLEEMEDPFKLNPYIILHNVFKFGAANEFQEAFGNFCVSAMEENYKTKERSPGGLLFYSERLELMIEACYLLYNSKEKKKVISISSKKSDKDSRIKLSEEEWNNPSVVFDSFFEYMHLPEWKLLLHNWTEAALSNYSVVENVEPKELLPFYQHIEKLIEAAYAIQLRVLDKDQ